jgi:hypothetical protein
LANLLVSELVNVSHVLVIELHFVLPAFADLLVNQLKDEAFLIT